MAINLTRNQLRSLLACASKKDVRYYLNGVLFDHTGYAVATDGRVMLAIQIEPFEAAKRGPEVANG